MASCAWLNAHGCPHLIVRSSGILRCVARFVITQLRRGQFFRTQSNRTKLALTGLSKAQIRENITAAIAKNELPMPEAGAMSYMMSKAGNLGDSVGHWCPHLMFHVPKTDDASWGADLAGSPVLFNDEYRDVPEPETIFMVTVLHWSDGTAAPQ